MADNNNDNNDKDNNNENKSKAIKIHPSVPKRELTWLSNNENEDEEGELPPYIEKVLQGQHVRRKCLYFPIFLFVFGTGTGFFFGLLLSNAYVGYALGLFNCFVGVASEFSQPDYGKGVFRKIIVKDTKSFEDVIKKGDKTMGVMSLLFGAILAILPVITLLNPDSTNYTLFGKYTYIYLYIGTITTPLGCFCVMYSQRLKLPMLEYISKAWVSQIKDYLKRIREILLEYNENGGKKGRDKTLKDIHIEQEKIERFAREINKNNSLYNGMQQVYFVSYLAICVLLAAIVQMQKDSEPWKTIVLILFAVLLLFIYFHQVHAVAYPNIVWQECVDEILNDARIQYNIFHCFEERFDQWIYKHEISNQRAFNVKITTTVMFSAASLIGSAVSIAIYFMMGEEVERMGMGGGG